MLHPIRVKCGICANELTILNISFSLKGEVHFELFCFTCEIRVAFFTSWDKIICFCHFSESDNDSIMLSEVQTIQ